MLRAGFDRRATGVIADLVSVAAVTGRIASNLDGRGISIFFFQNEKFLARSQGSLDGRTACLRTAFFETAPHPLKVSITIHAASIAASEATIATRVSDHRDSDDNNGDDHRYREHLQHHIEN